MTSEAPSPLTPITPEVLAGLLDRHAAALELYARQFSRAADDAVQEALVELARQRSMPDDVLAWLYRVVRNKALTAARAAGRRQRHEGHAAEQRPAWFIAAGAESLDAQTATDALAALPEEQREVVVAHLWGGLTFQQIAQVTGASDSTAHRRYLAALTAIRERLNVPCAKNP
jgi:RNA polymerase sigma factor (sigma-70 family)